MTNTPPAPAPSYLQVKYINSIWNMRFFVASKIMDKVVDYPKVNFNMSFSRAFLMRFWIYLWTY